MFGFSIAAKSFGTNAVIITRLYNLPLQASEELQQGLEEKLRQAIEAKEHVEQRMALLEKERQDLLEENIKITEESNNLVSPNNKKYSDLDYI